VAHLVTAIISPHRLGQVHAAIRTAGTIGLTVSEVHGYGRQGGKVGTFRGTEYTLDFVPKVKVEVVIEDSQLDTIIEAITDAARTGKIGDGKIWAVPLARLVRIRTGETGDYAL
jgi:nitrogen regulatory protein P-II 1